MHAKRADRAIKNQFIIICKVQTSKDRNRDPKTGRPSEREREGEGERVPATIMQWQFNQICYKTVKVCDSDRKQDSKSGQASY